jgi:hypothetical protein
MEPEMASPVDLRAARKVLFSLSPDSEPLKAQDAGFELSEDMKFDIIVPALERLVRQVERTFEHFDAHIGKEKVSKLFVTSAMNVYQPMVAYVGEQLGIEAGILDPFCEAASPLDEECRMISLSERVSLLPALGMALSDNTHTPNLLFSSKDKQQVVRLARVNRIIVAASVAAVLVAMVIFLYEFAGIEKKRAELTGLKNQLALYQPRIDRQSILGMASAARAQKFSSGAYSERYRGMAVIGELSAITPANVRLISLKTDFGALPADQGNAPDVATPAPAEKRETAAGTTGDVTLDGIIVGHRRTLESSLAAYMIQLQSSPIFRQVIIQRNSIERFQDRDTLRFTINMKVANA